RARASRRRGTVATWPSCVPSAFPMGQSDAPRNGVAFAQASYPAACRGCHLAVSSRQMASTAMHHLVASLGGRRTLGREVTSVRDLHGHVRRGLPYASLEAVMKTYGFDTKTLSRVLAIPERTLARRRHQKRLPADESDRVVRMARIAALAEETL